MWLAVPLLFYAAPPGDLAQRLAIGHEFRFDAGVGPPLAYWLGEIAFRAAGLFGVYLLAQACVVATYWSVFALGRMIVGPAHAAMAVLLMVGICHVHGAVAGFQPARSWRWRPGPSVLLHYCARRHASAAQSWYALGVAPRCCSSPPMPR